MNHFCSKCRARTERLAAQSDGVQFGETWSGKPEPFSEKVWYNVSLARQLLAPHWPLPADLLEDVSVAELWAAQVSVSQFEAGHLDHVDLADPLLLVTTHETPEGGSVTLIDGIHRVARAHRDGIESLKAVRLSLAVSQTLLIDPQEAVFEELVNEILATGGEIKPHGRAMVVVGGNPAPQAPDDHPLRAEMLAAIRGGPTAFDISRAGGGRK